jgi:hypothetical protein
METDIVTPAKKKKAAISKSDKANVFWSPVRINKENNDWTEIKIDYTKFIDLMFSFGFRRYDIPNGFVIVRVIDNVIEQYYPVATQDFFLNWFESLPNDLGNGVTKDRVKEKIYGGNDTLFSDKKLSLLGNCNFTFCVDKVKTAYLFFKNGFVECTPNGWTLKNYKELSGIIWKNQMLNREFDILQFTQLSLFENAYARFLNNVSGGKKDRFNSLCSLIGYLLHSFYECKLRLVVLTDSEESDGENGRTGKTLFGKMLGKMKNYIEVSGKDFKPDEKFKWQSIDLSTQIVHLNDAKKNFTIESLFNDITEGVSVEQKNKVPFNLLLKMLLSSNYTLKVEGASAKDRVVEFEFANYYSDILDPEKDLGKRFFEGNNWLRSDTIEFDNLMCHCICLYLREGIVKVEHENLNFRKLIEQTNPDFVEFMESKIHEGHIVANVKYDKAILREEFLKENSGYENSHEVKRFAELLRTYTKYSGQFLPSNPKQDEIKSNGKGFIIFRDKNYIRGKAKTFVDPS